MLDPVFTLSLVILVRLLFTAWQTSFLQTLLHCIEIETFTIFQSAPRYHKLVDSVFLLFHLHYFL